MNHQICEIDTSFFTSNVAIGGNVGSPFYMGIGEQGPMTGTVVRSLMAWLDTDALRGMQVELTDGTILLAGHQTGKPTDKFYFESGEKVAYLNLWASGSDAGGRSGGVYLKTDQGREFNAYAETRTGDPYQPEIGSGILVGVYGRREGYYVDALGFALLRRVEKAQLTNVEYPKLSTLQVQTRPKDIKTITYDNTQGKTEQQFTFAGSESVTTTSSWSVTAGMETGVETEVKAGFPILAEAKMTVSVTVSVSGTYGRENSKTEEQSFSFPINAPAGEYIQATATLYEGDIDTEYTGNMVYTLDSGKTVQYAVQGTYSGVSASQAVVTIKPFAQ